MTSSLIAPSRAPLFDDGKEPGALRTIGEVAKALNIRQHVLRYWEEQFPVLSPVKRSGGRRYYRPEDVALIVEIDRLVHHEHYTLKGAAKALTDRAASPVPPEPKVREAVSPRDNSELVAGLRALRDRLADALTQA